MLSIIVPAHIEVGHQRGRLLAVPGRFYTDATGMTRSPAELWRSGRRRGEATGGPVSIPRPAPKWRNLADATVSKTVGG